MKEVVSVSLGSRRRDHTARATLLGEEISLERRGTDGDLEAAHALIRELDGKVDAIGLGGLDVYLVAGGRRYVVEDGRRLTEEAKVTPVVDGSSIKNTLERDAVLRLAAMGVIGESTHVLMVSGVDRFGMAEAFARVGCQTIYGDLMFTAGIPYAVKSLDELAELARKILPEMSRLPLSMLYPQGKAQEVEPVPDPKFAPYYEEADLIAGDWHLIRKHLPTWLGGKTVLTNTTTKDDVTLLRERGVRTLITTTPVIEGRSFGTNVMEGAIVALSGKRPEELGEEGFRSYLERLEAGPTVEILEDPA